jgi:hypothetical protein
MVYEGETVPEFLDGEEPLARPPIRIVISKSLPRERLDPVSRVHYAKTYTVEHNVKVMVIGRIAKESERTFLSDLLSVQEEGQTFAFDN